MPSPSGRFSASDFVEALHVFYAASFGKRLFCIFRILFLLRQGIPPGYWGFYLTESSWKKTILFRQEVSPRYVQDIGFPRVAQIGFVDILFPFRDEQRGIPPPH